MLVCFTSAVNKSKIDAVTALRDMGLPCEPGSYYAFENDSLTPLPYMLKARGFEYPFKDETEAKKARKHTKLPETYWEQNSEEFEEFLEKAESLTPLPGKSLAEIANKRDILVKIVHRYSDEIVTLQDENKRLKAQLEQMILIKQQMNENEDYLIQGRRMIRKSRTIKVKKWIDTPLPEGKKATQCLTCKHLCHPDCHLDRVYSQGHLNLKRCAAFCSSSRLSFSPLSSFSTLESFRSFLNPKAEKRPEECGQCKHDYTVHAHTTTIREQIEVDQIEYYYDEQKLEVTDFNKKQRYNQAEAECCMIEEVIKTLREKSKEKEEGIQAAYRWIAHLHKELAESAISSTNEYFKKYLDYLKELTQTNPKLSLREMEAEMLVLKKAEQDYEAIKHALESTKEGTWDLTDDDRHKIQAQYRATEEEQQKIVAMYQGDRRQHDATQVSKKKSVVWSLIQQAVDKLV